MRIKVILCFILIFSFLFLSACGFSARQTAGLPQSPDEEPMQAQPKPEEISAETDDKEKIKKSRAVSQDTRDLLKKQAIDSLLDQGNILAALEGIDQNVRQDSCGKDLSDSYIRALNSAIKQAGLRLEQNRPDEAGLLFRAVKNKFPRDPEFAARILLTPAELETEIALCADRLMEQGLVSYRQGRLDDAIFIWNRILAFDPHHQASRNAIQTAETQQSNLEKIGNGAEKKP